MSLVIGTNRSALFAQDALRSNFRNTATTMERLSTGVRVNSSKDDAAGLAIGQSMTAQIRGLNQAVRNINDGINLIQTADGGLNSISQLLQRMRELAVQSANGSNSDTQRAYLQQENAALQTQINTVVSATTWNGQSLLDGSYSNSMQIGSEVGSTMDVVIPGVLACGESTTTYLANTAGSTVGASALLAAELTINAIAIGAPASNSAKDLASAINLQSGANDVTATARVTNTNSVALTKPSSPESIIDLGIYGKLISPVQVNGDRWYYYWDRSGDGSELRGNDTFTHTELDLIFSNNSFGQSSTSTNDQFHFATINGIDLSLPTLGLNLNSQEYVNLAIGQDPVYQAGTSVGSTPGFGSILPNSTYSDYLSLSDAYNGVSSSPNTSGHAYDVPSNWHGPENYWTASSADPAGGGHIVVDLGHGRYSARSDSFSANVALEVLSPKFFDVIDYDNIQINGISVGMINAASTGIERVNQIQLAINAITSSTSVTASFDVTTGGLILSAPDGRDIEISTLTSAAITGSTTGIALNGSIVGNRTVTTFRSGIDLSSTGPTGITISLSGSAAAATGLISQSVPATATSTRSSNIDISTVAGANSAIGSIDEYIDSVSSTRSSMGSYINTLTYAADNATNISSNATKSRSTIIDADYAIESTNLAKTQIVQQAATAMLAQANQQPQAVMALLKNLYA